MNKHVHSKGVPAVLLAAALAFALVLAGCAQSGSPQAPEPAAGSEVGSAAGSAATTPKPEPEPEPEPIMRLRINDEAVGVAWEDNEAAAALRSYVENDCSGGWATSTTGYGGFEQVGDLRTTLPSADEKIAAQAGDIMLYNGNQIVVFYGNNTWSYTRLGRITNKSAADLNRLLGGDEAHISLRREDANKYTKDKVQPTHTPLVSSNSSNTSTPQPSTNTTKEPVYMYFNGQEVPVFWERNATFRQFRAYLEETGPLTLETQNYVYKSRVVYDFLIPEDAPKVTTARPGDIVLGSDGRLLVVYDGYEEKFGYTYTLIGRIHGISLSDMREYVLAFGELVITLSLEPMDASQLAVPFACRVPNETSRRAIPFNGMSEKYIDQTVLGPHHGEVEEVETSYKVKYTDRRGRTSTKQERGLCNRYEWRSLNGKDELVFAAYCRANKVVRVERNKTHTSYWPKDLTYPNLYADGEEREDVKIAREQREATPPDPLDFDYESAEDYADDTYTWFAQHGYDDPYGAALRYYEDNGPVY